MKKQFTEKDLVDFGNYLLSDVRRDLFESEFNYNDAQNKLDTVQPIDIKHFLDCVQFPAQYE